MGEASRSHAVTTLYSEPVSPIGRISFRREFETSIDCFLTFENAVDVDAVKRALASSILKNCPRFRSLLVTEDDGRQRWMEQPDIRIDDNLIILPEEEQDNGEYPEEKKNTIYISNYLAALRPLRKDKPLWEVHVLPPRSRSLVLRLHHSLGDCVSLLALLLSSCDTGEERIPVSGESEKGIARLSLRERLIEGAAGVWKTLKAASYTLPGLVEFAKLAMRKDKGFEGFPRKQASLELCMDDMKAFKNKLDATINDVFVGVISYGIAKYEEIESSKKISKDGGLTGLAAVNIRGEGTKDLLRLIRDGKEIKWGNRIWYFALPIKKNKKGDDPLNYVREAKKVMDGKKISFEAQWGNKINALITTYLGLEAVDIHMTSYNGRAFIQFLVAEEIIPDPELLSTCVEEALKEMKAKL